ncbi:MAG: dTDP-4-dehydrorhamnose 3,5-epimerase [Hyphomonadaceae bacterium]
MFERFDIEGPVLVKPRRFGDERGYFMETYRRNVWSEAGIDVEFVQHNHSFSAQKGVVRGLHFQTAPHPQAKLVRCTRGALLDVAVDIREGSPTFSRHVAVELSPENGWQLYVPAGFAHGFCTLTPDTELQYLCSDYYAPACDAGIAFDDPDLAIAWPVTREQAVLSDKDTALPRLRDFIAQTAAMPGNERGDRV